jgi:hypothetical protein
MSIDTSKLDKETKRQYWDEVIQSFEASGLKLKEYCSQNGLKYDHMAYYLQQHRKQPPEAQQDTTDFIPLQVETAISSQYTIRIDNSIEIKLPTSSGIHQVAALIAQLRKVSC